MATQTTHPAPPTDDRGAASAGAPARILVLVEPSRNSVGALREAAACCGADTRMTVVSLAPQDVRAACCARGPGVEVVNCVVRDAAEDDLREAREIVGDRDGRTTFTSLVGRRDPPLELWAAAQDFDLIVLPARRLAFGGHPFARRLRRATRAEVRLVG
jgi:hypothetical protein